MTKNIPIPQAVFKNPKYQGKHVLLIGNKVIAAGTWEKVSKAFDKSLKKTKEIPALTYIPKGDALILRVS